MRTSCNTDGGGLRKGIQSYIREMDKGLYRTFNKLFTRLKRVCHNYLLRFYFMTFSYLLAPPGIRT